MLEVIEHTATGRLSNARIVRPRRGRKRAHCRRSHCSAPSKRNPLECWATQHFEQPIVAGGLPIGHVLLVHEPAAIRRVLLDNAANYRKDRLQRRVLSAGLNDGLLSAEGEQWRLQRRVVAPMFARRTVMDFTAAMMGPPRPWSRGGLVLETAQPST